MTAFAQARADLAEAMAKLVTLERVFGMMEEYAGMLSGIGQSPELTYDPATGRIALEVVVGRVPPRLVLTVDEAAHAALAQPEPAPAPPAEPALRTGPWTNEEIARATEMLRAGRSNKEIAGELGRTATGIHFKLEPLRAEIAEAKTSARKADTSGAPLHLTRAERRVWEHLDAISDAEWSDQRSLELVIMLGGGHGAEDAAARWSISKSLVVARWNAMFPEKGVEAQALMVRVLRARLAAQVAA